MIVALIILVILAIALVVIYAYYGGFKKIEFKIENQGGETSSMKMLQVITVKHQK